LDSLQSFARAVGETGNVITFEPNPQNYNAILDHIELNGFNNVAIIQIGLDKHTSPVDFCEDIPYDKKDYHHDAVN
jgi:FkbM family methyltransferase